MSYTTKLVLLCAATSLLSQSAAGEAVVYPYNCDSTEPICQTDCVTAVHNICAGLVGPLTQTQATTVRGCTAKYIPYQGGADTKATCFANFQKILGGSNAAAEKCDGKTLGRVGGVLAMDANNQFVSSTSYAIFPANNNPNCVVPPSKIKEPVAARHNLLGTSYDCSSHQETPSTTSSQLSRINTRDSAKAKCGLSIAGAAVCSAGCAIGVFATIASFGLAGAATVAGCIVCTGGETYLVTTQCIQKHNRRGQMLGRALYGRPTEHRPTGPAYCSGSKLDSLALEILPVCLQQPFESSCLATA